MSNIYVVSDPKNPDNEALFLTDMQEDFEMLKEAISPAFEDEAPINPFDLRWKQTLNQNQKSRFRQKL